MLRYLFPFLRWFEKYGPAEFQKDLVAGVTVALVLIPQSMAYAQLAGLPPYYGLYAAFLPPMVAALFGSSRQLATGPVAVVSLMTAATLEPLAIAGSEGYIAYAIALAVMVGVFQFALGILRLGMVVNFLSHPVVNGFTNAAAIIIATSQLSKIFGVHVDKAAHHYETIARVIASAFHYTHWPTFGLAAMAFAIMYGLKRWNPKIPNVLVAVAVTTVISWGTGFRHNAVASIDQIHCEKLAETIDQLNADLNDSEQLCLERASYTDQLLAIEDEKGEQCVEALRMHVEVDVLSLRIERYKDHAHLARKALRNHLFEAVKDKGGALHFYPHGEVPDGFRGDNRRWRIRIGNKGIDKRSITLVGGGEVVGDIPKGLPSISLPAFEFSMLGKFMAAAIIISLLGFMEAISIAKTMAVKTGQRLDPNQELIGQGLANIIGAAGQSYPVSGSFSRSAVNLQSGAVTGLSSVVTSVVVIIVLLFFTPLLYHLPQAVLASVIMMAVFGLINVTGFVHAYKAKRGDGVILLVSFACTLLFAPHLDRGIFIGVGLSVLSYLYQSTKPRVTFLSRHADGAFRDCERWGLARCKHIMVLRFYGKLFFANTTVIEKRILEEIENMPELKHVVIVGNGISDIDASGEEIISQIVDELRRQGYGLSFTAMRDPVVDVLRRTGVLDKIGEENMYVNLHTALDNIIYSTHDDSDEDPCPLLTPVPNGNAKKR